MTDKVPLELSKEDLDVIAKALQYACDEIEDDVSFEEQIGVTRRAADALLDKLGIPHEASKP